MSIRTRSTIRTAVLAYLVVLISLTFFILPMLWIIYCSFRTQPSIFTGKVIPPLDEFTLENYATILSVTDFPRYFLNNTDTLVFNCLRSYCRFFLFV